MASNWYCVGVYRFPWRSQWLEALLGVDLGLAFWGQAYVFVERASLQGYIFVKVSHMLDQHQIWEASSCHVEQILIWVVNLAEKGFLGNGFRYRLHSDGVFSDTPLLVLSNNTFLYFISCTEGDLLRM
jgi:hypothetical protein